MSTKIVQFTGSKVKRLEAVDISFKENGTTVIGGANAQGKTSVLDMIMSAVKGAKYNPTDPIKDGNEQGEITVTLNNGIVIRRKFNGERSTLKVEGCSGSSQTFLNELFGEHALDVREFMLSRKKADILMKICGLDFTQIDTEYKRLYDDRTIANREADRAKKAYESMPNYDDAPESEVNTVELLNSIRELERKLSSKVTAYQRAVDSYDSLADVVVSLSDERARLTARLKQLDIDIPEAKKKADECKSESTRLRSEIDSSNADSEIERMNAQISNAEETNTKVRANKERVHAFSRMSELVSTASHLDDDVKANRETKKQMLEEANFPLAGLTIEDGEMRYKGRAWDGMSTAEQFMVATSIQAALKPDAPIVLLDHMEAFDEQSLAKFSAWCERKGFQVVGTRVSTGSECDYIITDGVIERGPE